MMYKLFLPDTYLKKEKSFIKKHPDLKEKYKKTLLLLKVNPYHPSLRLHKLQGTLKEYHSISINLNYRIVLELLITDKEIILLSVGKHSDVY